MYINLEGLNLCYYSSISSFTLLVNIGVLTSRIYLINIHTLGAEVFRIPRTRGKKLKDIL